jgi:hypothetical protein
VSTLKIPERKTYPQDWRAYNAAQTNEKYLFQLLLHDLCQGVQERPIRLGRRRLSMADTIFCIAFKVYSTVSGRRFTHDLKEAHMKGYLTKLPHYNSMFRYFENPELIPVLRELVQQSSLPLKAFEVDFAADSMAVPCKDGPQAEARCRADELLNGDQWPVVRSQNTEAEIPFTLLSPSKTEGS